MIDHMKKNDIFRNSLDIIYFKVFIYMFTYFYEVKKYQEKMLIMLQKFL